MESSPETSPNSSESSAKLAAQGAITLRPATLADAASIADIYNYEVENTTATMDLVPRSLTEQQEWLAERSGAFAAIVAVLGGQVVGFASLSPYKERAAYRPTVEDSVYVRRDMGRRGIGKLLLTGVIDLAATSGFHSVMARIEASGEASRALHTACGFREVGVEIEVGRKFNRWLDMVLMQKML
jgi:phosphinothricin acetyltransferase